MAGQARPGPILGTRLPSWPPAQQGSLRNSQLLPLHQKLSLPFSTSRSAADTGLSLPAGDQAPSSTARVAGEEMFPGSALSYKGCILSHSICRKPTKRACSDWSSLSLSLSGTLLFPMQPRRWNFPLKGSLAPSGCGVGGGALQPQGILEPIGRQEANCVDAGSYTVLVKAF